VFIAVNIDKDTAKGRKFIRQAKLSAVRAAYEPTGATVESYDPPTMPSTFVVGKRGLVRYLHKGYRKGDAAKLAKQLDKQLAK
jgi:hypothetical protein